MRSISKIVLLPALVSPLAVSVRKCIFRYILFQQTKSGNTRKKFFINVMKILLLNEKVASNIVQQ